MNHTLDLFKYMHEGAVVLTPNNRLSLHLIQSYDRLYRQNQTGPLVKPLCFSYESWLQDAFQQTTQRLTQSLHPILLSHHQQRYMWKQVLEEQQEYPVSPELLDMIQDSWQRCIFWQISPDHPALQHNQHTRCFQSWYQLFQQKLHSQNAITNAQLPIYLIQAGLSIPSSLMIWTCFDEFSPLQKYLQQTLIDQNCRQLFDDYQEKPIDGYCFPAKNQQEELHQAIAWTQQRLNSGDQHIAIIVPELQTQIQTIQTLFAHSFSSDLYNISYGKPLLDYPIISTALHWLALDSQSINAQQIRVLLQAPFISGGETEFSARSQMLQDSVLMTVSDLSWNDFLNQIKVSAPQLHACLQTLSPYPKTASPYGWTQYFKQRLHSLGFPGEIEINSSLYQCLNRFHLLFDELMSLNALTKTLSAQDAIQALRELSASVLFQVQKPRTPITVLGMLEASGCRYDSIWITNLTDQCLPQKTKFSPFLPIHLQKSMIMPHSDAQNEFERAQLVLRRFGYACDFIIYSYPCSIGDQPQLPTTLIVHYPHHTPIVSQEPELICGLEDYCEHYAHPPKLNEKLSGGTALLASQAKCPFQAFAAHRLKIKSNPSITDGLDLAERGQILHRVMETLWSKLENKANLLRMSAEQLNRVIQHSIQITLDSFLYDYPASLSALAQEVEYQRLRQLIDACLAWEKRRDPFQISALEHSYHINLAGLALQIRVDRLDYGLEQANQIVIDYKTSLPTTKPWLEERPEAPQLLLYALLDPKINTLIFIQLKAGRITLQGLSAVPCEEPGMQSLRDNESWTMYRQHWEQQLTLLATEIQQGHCEPKPKRSSLCQQCAFPSLCRV